MIELTDEILFYGGLLCAAAACAAEIICLCIFLAKRHSLKAQIEKEYGVKR